MFNVGGGEIILIALVALLVLGPDRLPGALRQAGKVMGELRRISGGFQTDLKSALADAEREAEAETRKADAAKAELEAARTERSAPETPAVAPVVEPPVVSDESAPPSADGERPDFGTP